MTRKSEKTPTPKAHPLTRSEFGRRVGRKPASITEACAGPLKAACLPNGRIDAAHPAAVAWAKKRGVALAALLRPAPRSSGAATPPEPTAGVPGEIEVPFAVDAMPVNVRPGAGLTSKRGRGRPRAGAGPATASETEHSKPRDVTDLLSCTLIELTTRHGSAQGFADWLDTRRQIADTARVESRNDRDAGRLISSELVAHHVIGMLDGQNRRLLNNAPRTIAVRAMSAVRSGGTLEQVTELVRSAISSELRITVASARKAIRACSTGDNPPGVTPAADKEQASQIHGFARDLSASLRAEAAAKVVDFLLKEIARAACGETWNATMAAEVMATKPQLAPEASRVVGNILAAYVTSAVTDAFTQEHREHEPSR